MSAVGKDARTKKGKWRGEHMNAMPPRRSELETPSSPDASSGCSMIDPRRRQELIAQAAYFRAKHRGFAPGHDKEDWCAAEREVDEALGISGSQG